MCIRDRSETAHNLSLNYNLVDNDHYYFNATLRYFLSDEDKGSDKNLYTCLLYTSTMIIAI